MGSDFNEIPRGIRDMIVHVAEFSCRDDEYIEGPRLLAESVTYDPTENRTQDVTYYANGAVHSKVVTTGDGEDRRSIIYRYRLDGGLRDKWLITYNSDGRKARGYRYNSQGELKEVPLEEEETAFFDSEQADEGWESFEREFDARGNWIRETKFEKKTEGNESVKVPTFVTYRTIRYL